jgi:hypothetical protein
MEITVKPEDIDSYVKKALLDSTVGKTFCLEIDKELKNMMSGYHNPVKSFVNKVLEECVIEYMNREEIKPVLFEAIAKTITPEILKIIVENGVYELRKRFEDN